MAEKLTSLNQLRKLAISAKADSAARVAELALLVAELAQELEHDGISVTLPASDWSNRELTIEHESFVADSKYCYFVGGDADYYAAWTDACIYADNIKENGKMKFHCMATPETDVVVNIIRLEVAL